MSIIIKYVGLKADGENAFKERTGITWFPGSKHPINDPELAKAMLRHPDVFAPDDGSGPSAPDTATPTSPGNSSSTVLPAWAAKGIELGLTDDQLEALAQAGGPESVEGSKLWLDFSGTEWAPQQTPAVGTKVAARKTAAKTAAKNAASKSAPGKRAKAKK